MIAQVVNPPSVHFFVQQPAHRKSLTCLSQAESLLASGKPYQTQIKNGNKGRGLVVQDINAPSDVVWGR